MTEPRRTIELSGTIDWKWVGVGFCFFVVFHLLPSYLLWGFRGVWIGSRIGVALWLFFGMALTGMAIGYTSRGVTIIEPGISAVVYSVVLVLAFHRFWDSPWNIVAIAEILAWASAACVIAIASAWVGELLQLKKEQQKPG